MRRAGAAIRTGANGRGTDDRLDLHFIEDFSLEEIAGITGVSVGTVKSRLHYGKKALRELLEDRSQ